MEPPGVDVYDDNIQATVIGTKSEAKKYVKAQIEKANIFWSSACIKIEQIGGIKWEIAPTIGDKNENIFDDYTFDRPKDAKAVIEPYSF